MKNYLNFATASKLSRGAVRQMADALRTGDAAPVSSCIDFICEETRGPGHGRARATMCRRLKHVDLTAAQATRLVQVIICRLRQGCFSEQFKDQLRLAAILDVNALVVAARATQPSDAVHIRRYAAWILKVAQAAQ